MSGSLDIAAKNFGLNRNDMDEITAPCIRSIESTFDVESRLARRVEHRFWPRIARTDGCWIWNFTVGSTGYGVLSVSCNGRPRTLQAHRVAYVLMVGPIPEGLELDHLCRERRCVNPEHLEPVTTAENRRRSERDNPRPKRTHCRRGHRLDDANTYGPDRVCRTCRDGRTRAWRAAGRGAR